MRITPLAVWISSLNRPDLIYDIIKSESQMTHSNLMVHDVNFLYSYSIKLLLNNGDSKHRAVEAYSEAFQLCQQEPCQSFKFLQEGEESLMTWLNLASKLNEFAQHNYDIDPLHVFEEINCREKIGWHKWGFVLSYYFLLRYDYYV